MRRTLLAATLLVSLFGARVLYAAETKTSATGQKASAPAPAAPPSAAPVAPAPAAAAANAPAARTEPSAAPPVTPPIPQTFPAIGPYAYKAEGRRDPFQNLSGTGGDSKAPPKAPAAGIAGIRVDELSVRGVMHSHDRFVAMIQGPDSRTYLIHQGDKLADGAVKSITPQGLVLLQDVVDPRAKDKTREVHKALRTSDDEKE